MLSFLNELGLSSSSMILDALRSAKSVQKCTSDVTIVNRLGAPVDLAVARRGTRRSRERAAVPRWLTWISRKDWLTFVQYVCQIVT